MANETCCTCARLLAAIPPQFNEKTEKPSTYDRQLDCCGRFICGFCIAVCSHSSSPYVFYQLRSDMSSKILGLHSTVALPKFSTCIYILTVLKVPSAKRPMLPPPFLKSVMSPHRIHFLQLLKSLLIIQYSQHLMNCPHTLHWIFKPKREQRKEPIGKMMLRMSYIFSIPHKTQSRLSHYDTMFLRRNYVEPMPSSLITFWQPGEQY